MKEKIIKDTLLIFSADLTTKVIGFLISILIARYLGDSLFGVFSFAIAFTGIFGILSDFGLKTLIRREIARDLKKSNKYFVNSLIAKTFLSMISLTILVAIVRFMNYSFEKEAALYIAALSTIALSYTDHIRGIFQAHGQMAFGSYLNIGRNLIRFMTTYILLILGYKLWAILIVMLMVRILELIVSYFIMHFVIEKIQFQFDLKQSKYLMLKALPFGFSSIFILIYYKIDITMLSFMTTDQIVGRYSAAYNLIEGLLFLPLAFTTAITPLASRLFLQSINKMKNLCVNALKYVSIISFPIAVGTTLLADKIIILVYGQEYANSSIALAILIWSIIPTFMHFVLGLFVVSTNNEVRGMINTGSCAALNVILNLFLIPKYGLVGSAIATIVTEVFLVIMNYGVLVKVFREFNIVKIVYKPLIASLGMGVIFFIRDLNLLLVIFIGAIAYLTILLLIRGFDKKDKERVLNIVRRRLQYENK